MMGKIKHGDRWYEATLSYKMQSSSDGVEIFPLFSSGHPVYELGNQCPHCHRGEMVQVVYRSFEEAVNAGLFVETSAP